MTLTPAARKFVLHWGEMAHAWGINRTMAQVHALLFISPEPLDAEEISAQLDVSRSNVSTSLKELIAWGVAQRVHAIGDRRDRFTALKDVMETFRVVAGERKRREIDPAVALLEECLNDRGEDRDAEGDRYTRQQIAKMLEFTRMLSEWYAQVERLPSPALMKLLKGGTILARLAGGASTTQTKPEPTTRRQRKEKT